VSRPTACGCAGRAKWYLNSPIDYRRDRFAK
jgi:hypothetical protein